MCSGRPKRIRRQRAKGWRMPEGAVYVGRPSGWGNQFVAFALDGGGFGVAIDISAPHLDEPVERPIPTIEAARVEAVRRYRDWLLSEWGALRRAQARQLRGRDLVCWCPLDQPCHADVLLEIANGDRLLDRLMEIHPERAP